MMREGQQDSLKAFEGGKNHPPTLKQAKEAFQVAKWEFPQRVLRPETFYKFLG